MLDENIVLERALSITSRTSFTPALTADNVKNSRSRVAATMRARVVLPTPGGPQSMNDDRLPEMSILRRMEPSPTRCFCPTYSSRFPGLILSGRGGSILLRPIFPSLASVISICRIFCAVCVYAIRSRPIARAPLHCLQDSGWIPHI